LLNASIVQRRPVLAVLGAIVLLNALPARADGFWSLSDWRLAAYVGPVTHSDTSQVFTGRGDFNQGGLAVLALSREFIHFHGFSLEAEGQIGQHFAQLHEQEINLVFGVRYSDFGWSDRIPTSFAMFVGPSYEDWSSHSVSSRYDWENYLGAELAVALPWASRWSGILRYHHRSSVSTMLHPVVVDDGTMFGVGIKYDFPG
jgi:hypothetical protein